ncbi:MAG TPA: outer membrane beta-barrel protein [Verrucomicrobiae bacterium]
MNSSSASFRRLLKLLVFVLLTGIPVFVKAQLPPPNVLLTEPRPALLVVGPVDIHVRASASFIYDDNISLHDQQSGSSGGISTGAAQEGLGDDFIFTFSPGIIIAKPTTLQDSRTAFSLDYSPSFIFFLKNDEENSIDHAVKAEAGYAFTKLTLGLAQNFSETAGGVVDVGNRVDQKSYQTAGNARYEMTEKTFLQLDGSYRLTDYETLTDSDEWSVTPTVNYQISPKVTLGLGITYGRLSVSDQTTHVVTNATDTNTFVTVKDSTQDYLGPTLRASYRTTEKTDISLSVGVEYRKYSDGSSALNPVFSLAGSYRPFEGTSFTIEGHRREQSSAVVSGANYISTGLSLSARQRLRERLFGTITASYDNADYEPVRRNVSVTRQDDYFLLRYGVEAIVGRSWTIGLFHQYREDKSTDKSFSFSNNQVGIQAAWGR